MKRRINDTERESWVLNDAGLYNWFLSTRKPMRKFLREEREELDAAIFKVIDAEPGRR